MIQQTSIIANEKFKAKRQNDHRKILAVLSKEKSYTYNEIAYILRENDFNKGNESSSWSNPNKVSRRMAELVRSKKVSVVDIRKCRLAGSLCQTYIKL